MHLCRRPTRERDEALQYFYDKWKDDSLVMLIWLSVQAQSEIPGNLDKVRALMEHSAFDIKNPNKVGQAADNEAICIKKIVAKSDTTAKAHFQVYSLLGGFSASSINFHARDGSGYSFFADALSKVDKVNPQVAARMAAAFTKWRQVQQPGETPPAKKAGGDRPAG